MESSGPYILLSRLGEGGMAEVFKAYKQGPEGWKKPIALKRILPKFADHREFIQMLSAEARLHAHLEHPNIVQILDFFRHEESFVMALEYVPGKNLRTAVNESNRKSQILPWQASVHVMCEVLRGLDYAHKRRGPDGPLGIVHRDVSPQNVLLSYEGLVKLSDFGIALASIEREKTEAGVLKGKHRYLAPEQIERKPTDFRADIFSTGVVLYEILANEHPFPGENEFQVMKSISKGEFKPLTSSSRDIPPSMIDVVHKALKPDPAERFASADQFRHALIAIQDPHWLRSGTEHLAKWMLDLYPVPKDREEPPIEKTPILHEIVPQESLIFSSTKIPAKPLTATVKDRMYRRPQAIVLGLLAVGIIGWQIYSAVAPAPVVPQKIEILPTSPPPLASPTIPILSKSIKKSKPEQRIAPGALTISGPVGAAIFLNGQSIGKLPMAGIVKNLKPGEYLISMKPEKGPLLMARARVLSAKLTRVHMQAPKP